MDFKSSRREVVRVCKFCGREFKTVFRNLNHCLDCSELSDRMKREKHAKSVRRRREELREFSRRIESPCDNNNNIKKGKLK